MFDDERNQENPQDELSEEEQFAAYVESTKDEAPEPEQEEPKSEGEPEPEAAQTQAPQKPSNIVDELPEEWRERVRLEIDAREKNIRDLDNRYKAQAGQLAPTQRKLAELERQLSEAKKRQEEKPAGMSQSNWERYKSEFGEESQAIEELVNPLRDQLKFATETLAELQAERQFEQATQALAKEHPDWDKYDADPVFGEWFDAQGDVIKEMFPEGQRADPGKVSWLLSQFKRDEQLAELWDKSQGQPAPAANPAAQAVVNKRQQQKQDVSIRSKPPQSAPAGRANAALDDEEAAYAAYVAANP